MSGRRMSSKVVLRQSDPDGYEELKASVDELKASVGDVSIAQSIIVESVDGCYGDIDVERARIDGVENEIKKLRKDTSDSLFKLHDLLDTQRSVSCEMADRCISATDDAVFLLKDVERETFDVTSKYMRISALSIVLSIVAMAAVVVDRLVGA